MGRYELTTEERDALIAGDEASRSSGSVRSQVRIALHPHKDVLVPTGVADALAPVDRLIPRDDAIN
jgi:hypothetical protein